MSEQAPPKDGEETAGTPPAEKSFSLLALHDKYRALPLRDKIKVFIWVLVAVTMFQTVLNALGIPFDIGKIPEYFQDFLVKLILAF